MDDQKALVIEPDPTLQRHLRDYLNDRGCQTVLVPTVSEALGKLAHGSFCFTLVDLDQGTGAARAFADLKLQVGDPGTVIGLTGVDARLATRVEGVDRAIRKSPLAHLERTIHTVMNRHEETLKSPSTPALSIPVAREMALWTSRRMQDVRAIIEEAAGVDVTVLITGETGTGKDVVARAIHSLSLRRTGPFVKVNCAAVPRELLESELFGHERGAFTGAHKLKIGKFEAAHNGTVFLDEIGDLHPALQAKLLHVLQDGDFSRVGGKSPVKVDVRVVAATNQDLERNVIEVVVPPLRERMEEIPGFVDYLVQMYAKAFHREAFTVPAPVMERLLRHNYPGNVRELENLVKRMIVLGDPFLARGAARSLDAPVPSPTAATPAVTQPSLREAVRKAATAAERDIIARVLEEHSGNRTRAAKALHISYRALLYKIKRVGLARLRPLPAAMTNYALTPPPRPDLTSGRSRTASGA